MLRWSVGIDYFSKGNYIMIMILLSRQLVGYKAFGRERWFSAKREARNWTGWCRANVQCPTY